MSQITKALKKIQEERAAGQGVLSESNPEFKPDSIAILPEPSSHQRSINIVDLSLVLGILIALGISIASLIISLDNYHHNLRPVDLLMHDAIINLKKENMTLRTAISKKMSADDPQYKKFKESIRDENEQIDSLDTFTKQLDRKIDNLKGHGSI